MIAMMPDQQRPDWISIIANVGAPLLVGVMLIYRIARGHWWSIAFMGIIFAGVLVVYIIMFGHRSDDDTAEERLPPKDNSTTQ
ncbi:MAG: hypothetical protein WD069_19990 [Planctomycetales bacterium]